MNKMQMLFSWIRDLGIAPMDAMRLTRTAQYQYRHYTIPKRTGGTRDIHHPTPQLKQVQRWLVQTTFNNLPVHEAVHSYVVGRSIRTHAHVHAESNYLLRLDFTNFFPSLNQNWVKRYLRRSVERGDLHLDNDALHLVARLVCRYSEADGSMALSIGAPSSPTLSNAILYELDCKLCEMANQLGVVYSRYADDVYFSARLPNILQDVEKQFRALVTEYTPELSVNERKTERRSRRTRRVVTGLVLTPTRLISIGRERKRQIRSRIYLFFKGELPADEALQLAGLLAFANDVEPELLISLRKKFGDETIDNLLSHLFARNSAA